MIAQGNTSQHIELQSQRSLFLLICRSALQDRPESCQRAHFLVFLTPFLTFLTFLTFGLAGTGTGAGKLGAGKLGAGKLGAGGPGSTATPDSVNFGRGPCSHPEIQTHFPGPGGSSGPGGGHCCRVVVGTQHQPSNLLHEPIASESKARGLILGCAWDQSWHLLTL